MGDYVTVSECIKYCKKPQPKVLSFLNIKLAYFISKESMRWLLGATKHDQSGKRTGPYFYFVKLTPLPSCVSVLDTTIQSIVFVRSFFTILSRDIKPNGVPANDVKWMPKREVGCGSQDDDAERYGW